MTRCSRLALAGGLLTPQPKPYQSESVSTTKDLRLAASSLDRAARGQRRRTDEECPAPSQQASQAPEPPHARHRARMKLGCRLLSILLRGTCLLVLAVASITARYLPAGPAPGLAQSQEVALLEFSTRLENFQDVVRTNRFSGWGQTPSNPCGTFAQQTVTEDVTECSPSNRVYKTAVYNAWTGVTCNPAGEVVCIHLPSFKIQGQVSALSALQGLPGLAYLNLAENQLSGPLSDSLGSELPGLQILNLGSNSINSSLGADWGSEGGWSELQQLSLQDNRLYGTLPANWSLPGSWNSLVTLDLSGNRLHGAIPDNYGAGNASWPALQSAVLQPGNNFCGAVSGRFPAVKVTGEFVTGPTVEPLTNFNESCSSKDAISDCSGDSSGDDLSHAAVAGIITGEVLIGVFLLLFSATIHRRYRWRHERSWVLFDWDVVADSPPKPFINFGARFGWGPKTPAGSGQLGADGNGLTPNGTLTPGKISGNGLDHAEPQHPLATSSPAATTPLPPVAPAGISAPAATSQQPSRAQGASQQHHRESRGSTGSFSDLIWEDSMLPAEDVVIQQNADGSLRQLGNGSFGKVYKGVLQDVHEIAVKVFEGYAGQREQELLLREISILRSCRNKNIVQFFGVTLHKDDIWMVMELMDGNLFRHLARGHHCTWYFRGRSIALDIARGMHFLHSRRIIHMDLKSPNILLSSSGTAKIADVGLARVMGSESIASQMVMGTMHWMAPEVLMHGRCTEKADIFSFGVIMWEICTAEAPSRGRMTTVSVPDECPEEVARLIEWCLHEDPEKRPSALDIITRIQSIPVTTRPVPQPPWYAR